MKKIIVSSVITALSISSLVAKMPSGNSLPAGYKFDRPLPINLNVAPSLITNESVSQFHHALEKSSGWLFDAGYQWLQPDKIWSRVAYKYILFPIVSAPINAVVRRTAAMHGKGTRLMALGGDAQFVKSSYEDYAANYWALLGRNVWSSIKSVFTGGMDYVDVFPAHAPKFTSKYAEAYINSAPQVDLTALQATAKRVRENDSVDSNKVALDPDILKLRDQAEAYLTNKGKLLLRTAGYNAHMQHARYIEDTLWYDAGGHLAQISNHALYKLTHAIDGIGLIFARNDSGQTNSELGRISAAYKTMDIDLSWKMMGVHSLIAFFGSAEFWGRLFEENDYLTTGDVYIKAPEYKGFRLPNIGFFLNTSGPSYQVNTGYRYGEDWFFPVAIEFVFQGPEKTFEATLGVRKKFAWKNLFMHAELVVNPQNKAAGGKVSMGMQPHENIFFEMGARLDHVDTLEGERNIRSLENDKWCISGLATVGLMY